MKRSSVRLCRRLRSNAITSFSRYETCLARATTMEIPKPEVVFSYLLWRAAEEENDAEFLEECAAKFDAIRERFLRDAKNFRTRAENIRAPLRALYYC